MSIFHEISTPVPVYSTGVQCEDCGLDPFGRTARVAITGSGREVPRVPGKERLSSEWRSWEQVSELCVQGSKSVSCA